MWCVLCAYYRVSAQYRRVWDSDYETGSGGKVDMGILCFRLFF